MDLILLVNMPYFLKINYVLIHNASFYSFELHNLESLLFIQIIFIVLALRPQRKQL